MKALSNLPRAHDIEATSVPVKGNGEPEVTDSTASCSSNDSYIEEVPYIYTLVNQERREHNLRPFVRSQAIEALAEQVVDRIASAGDASQGMIPLEDLCSYLHSGFVGQNIEVGRSVEEMHKQSVTPNRNSHDMITSRKFRVCGMATAKHPGSGYTYLVQIFCGKRVTPV